MPLTQNASLLDIINTLYDLSMLDLKDDLINMINNLEKNDNTIKNRLISIVGSPNQTTSTWEDIITNIQNSKNKLVTNLTNKGITALGTDSIDSLIEKVNNIKLGQGNAVESDVLKGKTFTNADGILRTGNIDLSNLIPDNIKKDVIINGIIGNLSTKQNLDYYNQLFSNLPPDAVNIGYTQEDDLYWYDIFIGYNGSGGEVHHINAYNIKGQLVRNIELTNNSKGIHVNNKYISVVTFYVNGTAGLNIYDKNTMNSLFYDSCNSSIYCTASTNNRFYTFYPTPGVQSTSISMFDKSFKLINTISCSCGTWVREYDNYIIVLPNSAKITGAITLNKILKIDENLNVSRFDFNPLNLF